MRIIGTAELKRPQPFGPSAQCVEHRETGLLEKIQELTCGKGVDVILEMLANVNLDLDLPILAPNGRAVIIGSRGRVEIDPRSIMSREATVLGMTLYNATDKELASMHAAFAAGLEDGTLRPVVSRGIPLADAAAAHHDVMEKSNWQDSAAALTNVKKESTCSEQQPEHVALRL